MIPDRAIGIFGGSFNPPHQGHRALVTYAQRQLGLSRVRVLVSPQNPLKRAGDYGAFEDRMAATTAMMRGLPFVSVEAESDTGPAYAVETVHRILRRSPGTPHVYLMGADSFAGLHRWKDWRAIIEAVPIAVINRPGLRLAAVKSPAARRYHKARIPEALAAGLADREAPAWCFLSGLRQNISSSEIRQNQNPL